MNIIIAVGLVVAGFLAFIGIPIPIVAVPLIFVAFIYALVQYQNELEPSLRTKKVVIVEDDEDTKNLLELAIKNSGHKVVRWIEGNERNASETVVKEKPDVIILDWKLGNGMLGSELITEADQMIDTYQEFKETYQKFRPKVVTYSASNEARLNMKDPEHFKVIDHWSKGMSYEDLRAQVAKTLEAL